MSDISAILEITHLRTENEELRKRIAELESRIVPGRFYKCGCPVKMSANWKAFCDEHCKTITDRESIPLPHDLEENAPKPEGT